MLDLIKIAVTGGLSCGKSTVCLIFKQLGAYVVSADEIVHNLLSQDTEPKKKIIEWLGSQVVDKGVIDRKALGAIVFDDAEKLRKLEKILHPYVKEEILKALKTVEKENSYELFVAEIPLLFESSMERDFDYTVTVAASPEIAKKRFEEKRFEKENKQNDETNQEWEKRTLFQMPLIEKEKRADFVIYNNGSREELKSQVQKLTNHIKNHESRRHSFRNE